MKNENKIRVTLVDPINWEPLDLYFKILDTIFSQAVDNPFY